jgi:HSP20 family protein
LPWFKKEISFFCEFPLIRAKTLSGLLKSSWESKMDYIKIRFGNDMENFESEFQKSFQDLFQSVNPAFCLSQRKWNPQMDLYETPEEIVIIAEIAGVEKENLEVEINQKAVRIFGQRWELPSGENTTYRLAEIQYGKFERILFLPSPIDPEIVSASYSNGLLKIRLAKAQMGKTHKIPISDE